ncbi:MAG TPA: ABC transporter permease [Puia sp.]|jgi:putative ABC transport system permease protein|nr:ABC transporter permease [Puia sp.]
MLRNYFIIAWRNITRHKAFTGINALGLAFGICACIAIYLITSYELGFDRFHPDKERIYRIVGDAQRTNGEKEFLNCPVLDAASLQQSIAGFEVSSGFHDYGGSISIPDGTKPLKRFENKIQNSYQSTAIITWPAYFDIFKYQWLQGNAQTLKEPFKVVLTESRARKYFGDIPLASIIGKTVIYDDSLEVHVSGIVKDWEHLSDFNYTDFISISTATHSFLKNQIPTDDWNSLRPHNANAFVKLAKGVTPVQINARLAAFVEKHSKELGPGNSLTLYLQPLDDIHFTKEFHRGDDGDDFRKPYLPTLYALMGVAVFILIIAVANFINLSTAQSIQRAKEIGVRKVLGGNKNNIMFQFLTETCVLTVLSVFVSILLVNPVLYLFKGYVPSGVRFDLLSVDTLTFLFVITLVITLLAGFYPAKVLASYLPALSLKGVSFQKGTGRINLRRALIVFQFTISLIFIIGAIVIGKQISFMDKADKGFNSDAIIVINHWRDREGKLKVFAGNLKHIAGIRKTILQDHSPMGFAQGEQNFKYKGNGIIDQLVYFNQGDEDFIPFYQMKLLAGRNIVHSDSMRELVINETYSRTLGFENPQDAIGKFLYSSDKAYPVVGVVADFHQGSFHEAIHPAVIARSPGREWSLAIKLNGSEKKSAEVKTIIDQMEKQWKKIFPDEPFNYSFLNEAISWLYGQEQNTAWLVKVAMGITIFISSMGLFGLGMFTAQRRTKEIGIRKVLGASVSDIAAMLSKDFVQLIVIAIVVASPIAWYFMNHWLEDFVYRTDISWWIFGLAGVFAITIALLTVSFHAIKAAVANPVESLRTE